MNNCLLVYFSLVLAFLGTLCVQSQQSVTHKLSTANNFLAIHLLKELSKESDSNILISPFSLSSVFGMLYYGTKEETAQELRKVLGYNRAGLIDVEVHSDFQRFISRMGNLESHNYTLNIANSIFVDKEAGILAKYKSEVKHLYNASIKDADFKKNSQQVVKDINNWVKTKTHGNIQTITESVSPNAVMVLLNAMYFKGKWKVKFDSKETVSSEFYNQGLEEESVSVPMMHMTSRLPYAEMHDFKALELPYKGENISMVILLPRKGTRLADVQNQLNIKKLQEIKEAMRDVKVKVFLPKFKLIYSKEISKDIQALGAKKIFNKGADFSGMTDTSLLVVSKVHLKAVLEVTEEGSEAAAASGARVMQMAANPPPPPPTFRVNRPFIFAIKEKRSDMFLFAGRVTKL